MALTPAERQRLRRARLKAGESVPICTSCGALLQVGRRERTDRQESTLCWSCWIKTPEGQAAENERKRKHVEANPDLRRQQTRDAVRRHRERQRGDSPPPP
jgi:DNA helicase TIP49 (TBP-interacting protein)